MAKKKNATDKNHATKKPSGTTEATTEDLVVWLRLPRPMSIQSLTKLGLTGAGCFGGNTCICAPDPRKARSHDAGIIVESRLKRTRPRKLANLLKDAGLLPAAVCHGGDTCIC